MTDQWDKARDSLRLWIRDGFSFKGEKDIIKKAIDDGEHIENERDRLLGKTIILEKELLAAKRKLARISKIMIDDIVDGVSDALFKSRPLAEPHQDAAGAELEPVGQPITSAAEPAPADVAPPEPEPGVGTDVPGDASEH